MKIVCMNNDFDEYDSYESICAEKVDDNCTFEGLLPYARKGNAYAQYFLSELYKKGVDVIANEERAAFWAKKAKNGFLKCAKEGAEQAHDIAIDTLNRFKKAIGFVTL